MLENDCGHLCGHIMNYELLTLINAGSHFSTMLPLLIIIKICLCGNAHVVATYCCYRYFDMAFGNLTKRF